MRLAVCVEFKTRRCGHLSIKACTPCLTGSQYLSLKLQCAIDEVDSVVFMVALWNRADHYIFALWFLLSSFFFFLA